MLRTAAILCSFTLSVPMLAGCGHGSSAAGQLETSELLELLEEQELKGDNHAYVEVDLGEYRVTHSLANDAGQISVRFHLYGIVPEAKQSKLEHALEQYQNRLRDAVIHLVQETDTEQLTDPGLAFFRSEVVAAINRVLQERLVKDVAFSDFSVEGR
jgi:flagellar basal body-associated protein FliL